MRRPSLCTVIPMYNRAHLIQTTLDSVVSHPLLPNKLVIVDDGSTDGSLEVVKRWRRQHDPRFSFHTIRQQNRGCPAARNRGAELAADCELLMFLDSDDVLPADLLPQAVDVLASNPRCVAAFRNSEFVWADEAERDLNDTALFATDPVRHMMTDRVPPVPSGTVIRTASHLQIGGYDEAMSCHEDADYMLRLSLAGPCVWLPGEPVAIRRLCSKADFKGGKDAIHNSSRVHTTLGHLTLAVIWQRQLERMAATGRVLPEHKAFVRHCWKCAAKAFLREGRRREAAWCFDRAIEVAPYDLRMHWRRFKSLPVGRGRSPDTRLCTAA